MLRSRAVPPLLLVGALFVTAGLVHGCGGLNIRCDGGGKGYSCRSVDGPPERHTRSEYQPPWADEYHDISTERPTVSEHVFTQTNATRQEEGVSSLQHDRTLSQIACWHNQDMLGHNYLGHNDSDDRLPSHRVAREHRRLIGAVGENAYEGGALNNRDKQQWARDILDTWMHSPGHRENIMTARWTHLGACVSERSMNARATQVFTETWAYFDEPLPWTMAPGTSIANSLSLAKATAPPTRYRFVSPRLTMWRAFPTESAGRAFNGTLHVPDSTGLYEVRFEFPTQSGGTEIIGGPWVRVTEDGGPS